MRLWSLNPSYLDVRGLVACWREALLAQAVLLGRTRGYRNHPQLLRFQDNDAPQSAIAAYLQGLHAEALQRGYRFDATRIADAAPAAPMPVTQGQIDYEWRHMLAKLRLRDLTWLAHLAGTQAPKPHPLFVIVPGPVAAWEVVGESEVP